MSYMRSTKASRASRARRNRSQDDESARLAVVSSQDKGAQDFIDAVWPSGQVYIDEDEAFKKALGGVAYRSWWLMKPSVLRSLIGNVRNFGQFSGDVTDSKTQLLGGTFVVKGGAVVYVHQETASFDNGDAKEMLAAALAWCLAWRRRARGGPPEGFRKQCPYAPP